MTIALITGVGAALCGAPVAAADRTPVTPPEMPRANGVAFTDNPSILDPRPVAVESWSRLPTEHGLAVHFTTGVPRCNGVHATVQETTENVIVELHGGTPPEAIGRVCIMLAVTGTLELPLQRPLRDRQVLSVS